MGRRVTGYQQQQDVTRLERRLAQLRGDLAPLPGNSQQHGTLTPCKPHGLRCPPVEPRVRRDNNLDDLDAFAIGVQPFLTLRIRDMQVQRAAEFIERFGCGFDHQCIARGKRHVAGLAVAALSIPHEAKDRHVGFFCRLIEFHETFADLLAVLGDCQFGNIGGDILGLQGRVAPVGDQPPSDEGDEGETCDGRDATHRREVEHAERRAEGFLADRGDDNVGRRADQRRHTTKDRGEAERHEAETGQPACLACRLDIDGHQQRQRGDVVHERGQHAADRPHQRDMRAQPPRRIDQRPGDQKHRARSHETSGDHQHQRYHERCRVAKTVKGVLARHDAQHHTGHEGGECHKVIAKAPPEQEAENRAEEDEENDLVRCHMLCIGADAHMVTQQTQPFDRKDGCLECTTRKKATRDLGCVAEAEAQGVRQGPHRARACSCTRQHL